MHPDASSASSATETSSPSNAFDDDRSTAWLVGAPPDGRGAWIEARFLEGRAIWGVVTDTGVVRTDAKAGDLFAQHAHGKKLHLRLDDDDVASLDVAESTPSVAFTHLDTRYAHAVRLVVDDTWPGAEPFGITEMALLVDASRLPSVPESIVAREVKTASTRRDAAAILHRFGVNPPADRGGEVTLQNASLVDGAGRERLLVVTFLGDPDGGGLRDEDDWLVFLGTTDDDRLVSLGADVVSTRTPVDAPIDIELRALHSDAVDDVVATWSTGMRAWTLQRGFPERVLDVARDPQTEIASDDAAPHAVKTLARTLHFDAEAFDYR